ncbi:hypothetical protein BCR34DRAFT_607599 [Clohesyomyces aquaticus]|uniref:Uncharacterized protein n=1 Tax=Clohesyomyces aquaticus TaxID=1231657 RepID=A0A1Y1YEW5_9PLEO|nr:hypothetical protein BCR34DRAFT_607599 [Clohesyomyces aquaticus]
MMSLKELRRKLAKDNRLHLLGVIPAYSEMAFRTTLPRDVEEPVALHTGPMSDHKVWALPLGFHGYESQKGQLKGLPKGEARSAVRCYYFALWVDKTVNRGPKTTGTPYNESVAVLEHIKIKEPRDAIPANTQEIKPYSDPPAKITVQQPEQTIPQPTQSSSGALSKLLQHFTNKLDTLSHIPSLETLTFSPQPTWPTCVRQKLLLGESKKGDWLAWAVFRASGNLKAGPEIYINYRLGSRRRSDS